MIEHKRDAPSRSPAHIGIADVERTVEQWLSENATGIACVIGDPRFEATDRVRSLDPEMTRGLEFDLVVLVEPRAFGPGVSGGVRRYVAMTRTTRRLVIADH